MRRLLLVILLASAPTLHAVPAPASPTLARELVRLLENASMQAFAAVDPTQSGRFVAALHVPGQLLVVEAEHPARLAVEQRIRAGMFQDVYLDLQGTPAPQGKFFVLDANADGLLAARPGSGSVDVVYEDGTKTMRFDGDARGQHLSENDYDARFTAADAQYAHLLAVLKMAFEARSAD
jgi:hypothetical protein